MTLGRREKEQQISGWVKEFQLEFQMRFPDLAPLAEIENVQQLSNAQVDRMHDHMSTMVPRLREANARLREAAKRLES